MMSNRKTATTAAMAMGSAMGAPHPQKQSWLVFCCHPEVVGGSIAGHACNCAALTV